MALIAFLLSVVNTVGLYPPKLSPCEKPVDRSVYINKFRKCEQPEHDDYRYDAEANYHPGYKRMPFHTNSIPSIYNMITYIIAGKTFLNLVKSMDEAIAFKSRYIAADNPVL